MKPHDRIPHEQNAWPDAIFYNGTIITMQPGDPTAVAGAVAVKGERIMAAGPKDSILGLASEKTDMVDLRGGVMLPGFIDSHGHFPWNGNDALFGVTLYSPPLGAIASVPGLLQVLTEKASTLPPGQWLFGRGYDHTVWPEKRHPTKADLDKVCSTRPIFIVHMSAHVGVANSVALRLANITRETPDPIGGVIGRDADGEPNGLLEGPPAYTLVQSAMPPRSHAQDLAGIKKACEIYAQAGVTTVQNGWAFRSDLDLLAKAHTSGDLFLRVVVWPFAASYEEMAAYPTTTSGTDLSGEHMITLGAAKLWADGSIYVRTAWLSQPYHVTPARNPHYRGFPRFKEKSQLIGMVDKLHADGWQIAIHTSGDQAIQDALDAWEAAQARTPRTDTRHISVHAHTAREDQLDRMKHLGISPSFFVTHTYFFGDRHWEIFLGPDRARRLTPCRTALDRGIKITLHNDPPVTPISPLMSIWSAVNRLSAGGREMGPELKISVAEALRALTIDAAWQNFEEGIKGSIEPGKLADFVVLEEDPLTIEPLRIRDIRIVRTIVGGRTVFTA